jgi:hypothetical protein
VGNAGGISRGDRNRNARLTRLRALVPLDNAIVGIDLADRKQMVVVCDHDSTVLARRALRCRAWDLGKALDWAAQRTAAKGYAGATVACEPTRAPLAGARAAGRGPGHAVRVRAAAAGVVSAPQRGSDALGTAPMTTAAAEPAGWSCNLSRGR